MASPTQVSLEINGAASGPALFPYLLAFEHADDIEKNADTLTLHFSNIDGRFYDSWYIPKGTEIHATISSDGMTLDCGLFYVDNSICSEPPAVYIVKATSIPVSGNFKNKRGGDAWEKTTLKDLCGVLASRNGLGLDYRATENPKLFRVDQDEESDACLVRRVATNFGLAVKCQNKTLIVFDEAEYDKQPPTFVFGRDITPLIAVQTLTTANNKVATQRSAYMSPETGRSHDDGFSPDEPPEGVTGLDEENDRQDFQDDPDPDDSTGDEGSG